MLANWIAQTSTTTGTGSLTVSSVSGFATFYQRFGLNRAFEYTILDAATDTPIECGIGYLSSSTVLVRAFPLETLVSGTLSVHTSPSAASIAGDTKIVCSADGGMIAAVPPCPVSNGSLSKRISGAIDFNGGSFATMTLTANTIYYFPFYVGVSKPLNSFIGDITTGIGASNINFALYTMAHDGSPDQLIAESGSVSSASAATVSASITAVRVPPGWYWGAIVASAAIAIRANSAYGENPLGWDGTTARYKRTHAIASMTYGSFPNTATAISSYNSTGSSNVTPMMWMGLA